MLAPLCTIIKLELNLLKRFWRATNLLGPDLLGLCLFCFSLFL